MTCESAPTDGRPTDVADDVRGGAADLGFVAGPEVGDDLDAQVVARDHLVLAVSPQHPWSRRAGVELAGRIVGDQQREIAEMQALLSRV